jgi:hypothetical protein
LNFFLEPVPFFFLPTNFFDFDLFLSFFLGIFGIPLSRSSKNGSILWDLKLPDVVSICFKEICNRGKGIKQV